MREKKNFKNFWLTLPGFMTGLASLVTAGITLMTFLAHSGKEAKEVPPTTPLFSVHSAPAIQLEDVSKCTEITGVCNWFTGSRTTIAEDGGLV